MDKKELKVGLNLLREDHNVFSLPILDMFGRFLKDGTLVDIVLMDQIPFSIESGNIPIRFGRFYGNRVILNTMLDSKHINPQFIFDAEKRMWLLHNVKYACFAEQEIGLNKLEDEDEES
jgi:hypothetical protein